MTTNKHLYQYLIEKIKKSGRLQFSEFMNDVLYNNDFGYYIKKENIFGNKGDFITTPITSPLFGECLSQEFINLKEYLKESSILEFGGGDASLLISILKTLQKKKCLPEKYIIIEISQRLIELQKKNIKKEIPELLSLVEWKKSSEKVSIDGLLIANEFFDSLPTERFKFDNDKFLISYISESNGSLKEVWDKITDEQKKELQTAVGKKDKKFPNNYVSELNMEYKKWVKNISKSINNGIIMIIDYGYNSKEYFLDDRMEGTLVCIHNHQPNFDPLINIGSQDISSFVNFSHISNLAVKNGLTVDGYLPQSSLLLNLGILEIFETKDYRADKKVDELNKLKNILLPNTMGEIFKTLVLTKNIDRKLLSTKEYNQINKL
ncbi:MAG: SAM-dependent methyltransferase [Pseudomonadota bacterium]|nr:SAM-dependent methyltransferase [Pseudomonadota bacterium]|tara:strand:- start:22461 stop:23594 length:1134 start_codon:yes stop_codon:yes gene_type:complete